MKRAKELCVSYRFGGRLGAIYDRHEKGWVFRALKENPLILGVIEKACRHKEYCTAHDDGFVAWFGEFIGKFLEGAVSFYQIQKSAALKELIDGLSERLFAIQAEDGYLGMYPEKERYCQSKDNWDAWNQYHCICGLVRWHIATGNERALAAAVRAAECMYRYFENKGEVDFASSKTMNLAISHAFMLLYSVTGEEKYRIFAQGMVETCWQKIGGNWLNEALEGKEFYQSSQPRWEALHAIETLGLLYECTGNEKYFRGLEQIWTSIFDHDVHNTGGFSTDEQACGTPYKNGIIETCCTVAWQALTCEYLRIHPNVRAADALEKTYFNAMLGAFLLDDVTVCYNAPMDGLKGGNYDGRRIDGRTDLAFQFHEGAKDFNCCQANATRGLAEIGNWGVQLCEGELYVNLYSAYCAETALSDGERFSFSMRTQYPSDGNIRFSVEHAPKDEFAVHFRIPHWVKKAHVMLNGEKISAKAGTYLSIKRAWRSNDTVELVFDWEISFEEGKESLAGRTCVYWGCLLLAYPCPEEDDPMFYLKTLKRIERDDCFVAFSCNTNAGEKLLTDFFSAGRAQPMREPPSYRTWLQTR